MAEFQRPKYAWANLAKLWASHELNCFEWGTVVITIELIGPIEGKHIVTDKSILLRLQQI